MGAGALLQRPWGWGVPAQGGEVGAEGREAAEGESGEALVMLLSED